MPLSIDIRQSLEEAHNAGTQPEPVPARNSQGVRLNLGGRSIALMSAQGHVTQAGKHWYKQLKKTPIPDPRWDDNAKTYRKPQGRTDFVRTRSGAEVQLRSWDPSSRSFRYTAAGKKFYERRPKITSCKFQ